LRYWRQPNLGYRNMVSLELFAEMEDRRRAIYLDSSLAEYLSLVGEMKAPTVAPPPQRTTAVVFTPT
jgi:hypothetical protein